MIYQIFYKSDMQILPDRLETEIGDILNTSQTNNQKDGITGLFLLVENRFLQLLEGEETKVKECLNRIKLDPRHSDVKVVMARTIEKRSFPDWSMYFHRLNGDEALERLGLEALKDLGISQWNRQFKDDLAVLLIESFARLASR